jgi:hypothetical protein
MQEAAHAMELGFHDDNNIRVLSSVLVEVSYTIHIKIVKSYMTLYII